MGVKMTEEPPVARETNTPARAYELGDDIYFWPPGPWTDSELDRRHEAAQRAFPGGLTYEQFVYLTLESARDVDELCHPASISNMGGHGHLNGATWHMWIKDGFIEHRGGHSAPLRWYITEKGRAELARLRPKYDALWFTAQTCPHTVTGTPGVLSSTDETECTTHNPERDDG